MAHSSQRMYYAPTLTDKLLTVHAKPNLPLQMPTSKQSSAAALSDRPYRDITIIH